jgi:hypothetical protein
MYLGTGFICVLSLIISLLFLYYGIRLANIYSDAKENIEVMERKFIHNKVIIKLLI